MAIFKCKMCGGDLEITPNQTVVECEYCGSTQTLPKIDDDRKANLYDRANHFRRNNEFDKAAGVYEKLLAEDGTDAEAYWSLVLCRFGIEYVEDPTTHKRVPTVNRAQYTSIFDDDNYKQALAHAAISQKLIYEDEAKAINEIQKGILTISQKEDPFDVFICYKETDTDGRRTQDSVLANDLYHQLTQEGFKVFFSRITLEDKLGVAYEPYIFAALNSAKVMVVLGTRPEYFNAVWVKNEWSRYLAIVKQSAGKKVLIPAYRDMDPYDLPEEFSHLQAQDMSKLGFMQDFIRGIKKIQNCVMETNEPHIVLPKSNPLVENYLFMAESALDGDNYSEAVSYVNKVIECEPKNCAAWKMKGAALSAQTTEDGTTRIGESGICFANALLYANPEEQAQVLEWIETKLNERALLILKEKDVFDSNFINSASSTDISIETVRKAYTAYMATVDKIINTYSIIENKTGQKFRIPSGMSTYCDAVAKRFLDRTTRIMRENEGHPGDDSWSIAVQNVFKAYMELSVKFLDLIPDDFDKTVQQCKTIISNTTSLMNSTSWRWQPYDNSGGAFGLSALINTAINDAIRGKGQWVEVYSLNEEIGKAPYRKCIKECNDRISQAERQKKALQKQMRDEFWTRNEEQKNQIQVELSALNPLLMQAKKIRSTEEERVIQDRIKKLEEILKQERTKDEEMPQTTLSTIEYADDFLAKQKKMRQQFEELQAQRRIERDNCKKEIEQQEVIVATNKGLFGAQAKARREAKANIATLMRELDKYSDLSLIP